MENVTRFLVTFFSSRVVDYILETSQTFQLFSPSSLPPPLPPLFIGLNDRITGLGPSNRPIPAMRQRRPYFADDTAVIVASHFGSA